MTTTEFLTEREEMWSTFFDDNHRDLAIAAEMLSCCHLSPETILRKTLTGLASSPCEVTFGELMKVYAEWSHPPLIYGYVLLSDHC